MIRGLSAALLLTAASAPAGAQPAEAFAVTDLAPRGRVLEAFAVRDASGTAWLVALSAEAMPPDEQRFLTLYPRGAAKGSVVISVPQATAAVDVADVGGAPGPEVLLLEATRLRILSARGEAVRSLALSPALPLPPRTRELGRLELAGDWSGRGGMEALLPDAEGFRLLALTGDAAPQTLAVPVTTIYGDPPPGPPLRSGFFRASLSWPRVFSVDEDGDGARDLVATTRYALTTFRGGAGLSAEPTRVRRFPGFDFEEERRYDSNLLLADFADLDGDGDADLIVHETVGTLTGSRAETRVHANEGGGADPLSPPAGSLVVEGGVATAELSDLDGDGRAELVQSVVPFGLLQLLRILTRSQAELDLRVYGFERGRIATPTLRWSDELTLPFDFKVARVTTLLPRFEGDYNGDRRRDLVYGDGGGNAKVRLGVAVGSGFGPPVASIPLGATGGASLSTDLDGDQLDEIVYWDPVLASGRLRVARNLGKLPGSPLRLSPAAP